MVGNGAVAISTADSNCCGDSPRNQSANDVTCDDARAPHPILSAVRVNRPMRIALTISPGPWLAPTPDPSSRTSQMDFTRHAIGDPDSATDDQLQHSVQIRSWLHSLGKSEWTQKMTGEFRTQCNKRSRVTCSNIDTNDFCEGPQEPESDGLLKNIFS